MWGLEKRLVFLKQVAPPVMLCSVQALNDLSGYTHQTCCCMSMEVTLAMQNVTYGWKEFLPRFVPSSKISNKFTRSFDFKQALRVKGRQRKNGFKIGAT